MARILDCQSEDAGSIPVTRSNFSGEYGEVVNALVCGTSIREFNSHYSPHCKEIKSANKLGMHNIV